MKPDTDFSLPFEGMPDFPEGTTGAGGGFWEHIAGLLEQIEKNTRGITTASGPGSATRAPTAERTARVVEHSSRGRGKSVSPLPQPTTPRTARAERVGSGRPAVQTPPPPVARPVRGKSAPSTPAAKAQGNARSSGRESVNPTIPAVSARERTRQVENPGAATPTKSQQEHTRRREEAVAREQSKGVLGILKKNLAGWDGSVATPDKGDLQNAAGLAAGGPVWSAIKEVKEAVEGSSDDDSSLSGILKKTLADKTGVTGAKERLEQAKKTARAKVVSWAGGTVDDDGEAHQGRGRRDKKGRFLKGQKEATTSPETKIAEESYALATREATADKKRHDELIEAVKGRGDAAGGGLFGEGGLLGRARGRRGEFGRRAGGRRSVDATAGRRTQRATTARGRRRGRFGLLAGGLAALGGGASLLSGDPTDIALDLGETALTAPGAGKAVSATVGKAAGGMGKAGGALGKVAGLGAKGAVGAAKAIPVAGQLLAAGMAIYDGVQGWNDTAMQQEAFGLADGQEASKGQKASTAAANILDMGGLVSGAAGLLGFDVSTADMAKGIYGIGDSIGSSLSDAWHGVTGFFSGDADSADATHNEGKQTTSAAIARETETDGKTEGLFDSLVTALSDLTSKIDEEIKGNGKDKPGIIATAGGFFSRIFGGESGGGSRSSGGRRNAPVESTAAYSGLGDVVNIGETGGKGTAMISSGAGDHGGVSYGRSQLASKVGSIAAALKWAKSNGYEDIYNELAPLNCDAANRNGQFAQKWNQMAQEKGGRLEQFDRAYQKQGYFDPMMVKIRTANPDLAKRIEANPALQEQVLSTAVQYGPNSGRYLSAASEVLNSTPDATDRDLLAGIQDIKARDAGSNFKSSSGAVQASVARRHGVDEKRRLLAVQDKFEKGEIVIDPTSGTATAMGKPALTQAPQSAVEATSQALQAGTQDAINRGVKYGFSEKDSASGAIDCSGWVAENTRNMMEAVNEETGKPFYGKEAKAVLQRGANGGAAGIIQSVSEATGELLGNADLAPENVREGMMIGMDTGDKGWDAGRFGGIDHIVQTYRDAASGRMMVSESSSGQGVHVTDYEEWYKKQNSRGAKLYGADATKLADAVEQDNTSPQAATPAVSNQSGGNPVQVAAVQELPPQPAPRYPDPEPLRPEPPRNAAGTDETAKMVALLSQLLEVTKQQGQKQEKDTEAANTPNIPMEYDNAYCANIAHDRA